MLKMITCMLREPIKTLAENDDSVSPEHNKNLDAESGDKMCAENDENLCACWEW